jgi:hypothetical protein
MERAGRNEHSTGPSDAGSSRETLRKLECAEIRESPDQEQLKRILRRRIAEMQSVQGQPSKYFGR